VGEDQLIPQHGTRTGPVRACCGKAGLARCPGRQEA
jgi:hypothetical protein